ncbi:unnamed protein product [Ectocarpus sp. 6 AP-2014]
MSGQADEFCLVEPLAAVGDDSGQSPGQPRGAECVVFAPAPTAAPDTPAPPPAGTPTSANSCLDGNGGSSSSSSSGIVHSVLADDELWGPPAGARRPFQARGSGGGAGTAGAGAVASRTAVSPPWTGNVDYGGGCGGGAGRVDGGASAAEGDGLREAARVGRGLGLGPAAAAATVTANGVRSTATPRRKRTSTSGINRERQFDGAVAGGTGGNGSRLGVGRRRSGPGNGRGGLSKKTLNIVTNLESHTTDVRSREEMEDLEEEKRLAEEERRFKENLRQKGDDFDHTIRILLLGDSGVGKTSLMTRFSEDKFAPTLISTAGVDYKVQTLDINGKRVRCQIWDTAGQERFHVITRTYYRGAHGIALAYDVTDDDSFKNVNYWMANIQTHAEPGHRMQKMILGNKVDIEDRAISTKDGQDVAKEFGVRFFEVSAKNGYGVSDAFYSLAVDIVAANKRGADDRRGASRLFSGGAARLRSSFASKKTSFLTGRKLGGVSWPGGTATSGGGGGGSVGAGEGGEGRDNGMRTPPPQERGGKAPAGEEDGEGGAALKSASERCKVS